VPLVIAKALRTERKRPLGFGRVAFVLIREDKLGSGSGGGDSLVDLLGHYSNIPLYKQPPPPSPTILTEVIGARLFV
jgi:hypothetical protein